MNITKYLFLSIIALTELLPQIGASQTLFTRDLKATDGTKIQIKYTFSQKSLDTITTIENAIYARNVKVTLTNSHFTQSTKASIVFINLNYNQLNNRVEENSVYTIEAQFISSGSMQVDLSKWLEEELILHPYNTKALMTLDHFHPNKQFFQKIAVVVDGVWLQDPLQNSSNFNLQMLPPTKRLCGTFSMFNLLDSVNHVKWNIHPDYNQPGIAFSKEEESSNFLHFSNPFFELNTGDEICGDFSWITEQSDDITYEPRLGHKLIKKTLQYIFDQNDLTSRFITQKQIQVGRSIYKTVDVYEICRTKDDTTTLGQAERQENGNYYFYDVQNGPCITTYSMTGNRCYFASTKDDRRIIQCFN